ncbi:hypothetical protein SAMN02745130_01012 [Thiothrix eikelboomii]|uniref:Uncharacterized protein n=1 Tax=Thiothrix eikelboomii TaxID=92487 RepID=A0A1T4W4R6_9GAMM|nr:hypothetical protein [Thiothrix eikelboomii]SKA72246.1 hypothetical protein SAMN02745130_01012 [Thiothrix eikelboomii]
MSSTRLDVSSLELYQQILLDGLRAHFGDSLETVQAYLNEQTADLDAGLIINTPALILEIERLGSVSDERGDGRDALRCGVLVHCILGSQTPHLQIELRNFSAEVMRWLSNSSKLHACGQVEPIEELDALPGRWKQGQAGYDSFVVTFCQVVYLGDSPLFTAAAPVQKVFYQVFAQEPEQVLP